MNHCTIGAEIIELTDSSVKEDIGKFIFTVTVAGKKFESYGPYDSEEEAKQASLDIVLDISRIAEAVIAHTRVERGPSELAH